MRHFELLSESIANSKGPSQQVRFAQKRLKMQEALDAGLSNFAILSLDKVTFSSWWTSLRDYNSKDDRQQISFSDYVDPLFSQISVYG
jgi:hypothetical protein